MSQTPKHISPLLKDLSSSLSRLDQRNLVTFANVLSDHLPRANRIEVVHALRMTAIDIARMGLSPGVRQYVCGFVFTPERDHVLLIEKNRPAWQKGLWNGIGGKIEVGETPVQAMGRECYEESGLFCRTFREFAILTGSDFLLHFFTTTFEGLENAQSMTDEKVGIFKVSELSRVETIPNVKILIPLALDPDIAGPVHLYQAE